MAAVAQEPSEATASFSELRLKDLHRVCKLIYKLASIHLDDSKKLMIATRLRSRLKATGTSSFADYLDLVERDQGEVAHFVAALTTNLTGFFREPLHFKHMAMVAKESFRCQRLNIWSAACSTGEEAYTIAMTAESIRSHYQDFDYRILATDIDERVLKTAESGVYEQKRVSGIPEEYLKPFMQVDHERQRYRVVNGLRKKIKFRQHALNRIDQSYPMKFDMIFLRNVLIYFQAEDQLMILEKVIDHLTLGGFLYIGHSESLGNFSLPIERVGTAIYRRVR